MKLKQLKLHADGTVAIVDPAATYTLSGGDGKIDTADLPDASTYTLSGGNGNAKDGGTAPTADLPDTTPTPEPGPEPQPEPGPEPQPEPAETTAQKILVWAKANKLQLGIAAAVLIIYIMYRRAQ